MLRDARGQVHRFGALEFQRPNTRFVLRIKFRSAQDPQTIERMLAGHNRLLDDCGEWHDAFWGQTNTPVRRFVHGEDPNA